MPTAHEFAVAAESLVGTRWRRHGRSAAAGLDCAGLPVCSLSSLGIVATDTRAYDAAMPSPQVLWRFCRENCQEQPWSDSGDGRIGLCAWRQGDGARHLVVMLSDQRIAHVDPSARGVVVVPAGWLHGRLVAVFRVNGINYEESRPWPQ